MRRRDIIYITTILLLIAAVCLRRPAAAPHIETRCDTVVVRDTIRDTVLAVHTVRHERVDTVWLRTTRDTVLVEVEVPIERKTYMTAEYRAVVEGFHPRLAEIEVYRSTVRIDRTETAALKRPSRWGIGVQAGYGITPRGPQPYIGIGVQYNIITW